MFEHRLGLALSKSISEIRSMSYVEFRSWQLFYLLEPWGWQNEEYYAAVNMAMLYNINRSKGKVKEPKEFMRDLEGELLKQLEAERDLADLSVDEQREILIRQVKKDFGIK